MDLWDVVLLAAAGFAAVVGLVRLMNWRRSQLADELANEIEQLRARSASLESAKASAAQPTKTE